MGAVRVVPSFWLNSSQPLGYSHGPLSFRNYISFQSDCFMYFLLKKLMLILVLPLLVQKFVQLF